MGPTANWQKRRRKIASGVRSLYLQRSWPTVPIEDIAKHLGISYWQVYHSFDGQEDIYRAAVSGLAESLSHDIARAPAPQPSAHRTIREYIRFSADIIGDERYRQLLFLTIRDAASDPWVSRCYETNVAAPLRLGLENSVARSGELSGLHIVLLHQTGERFLAKLEAMLALPKMLMTMAVTGLSVPRLSTASTTWRPKYGVPPVSKTT